jgi:hypothetical protein
MSKKAWASMNGEHVADLTARSLAATGKKTAGTRFLKLKNCLLFF